MMKQLNVKIELTVTTLPTPLHRNKKMQDVVFISSQRWSHSNS